MNAQDLMNSTGSYPNFLNLSSTGNPCPSKNQSSAPFFLFSLQINNSMVYTEPTLPNEKQEDKFGEKLS
jgi:hypothetical protein